MSDIGITGNCLIVAYNFNAGNSQCTGAYPTCSNGTILKSYECTNYSVDNSSSGRGVNGKHKIIIVSGNRYTTIGNLKDFSTYESGTVIVMY